MPYIPPDLHNWKETYRSPRGFRLHVLATTGSLSPPAGLLGGSWATRVALQVPAFVIEHPRAGPILVGTGLSPTLPDAPERQLGWLLARLTRPSVGEGEDLGSQLAAAGFAPARVRRVILPDCRFPQTGGLSMFREAEVIAGRADREWALRADLASGVRREELLTVQRWTPVDFATAKPLGTLPRAVDLLGDGSVWLLDAAGYTPGTMAVLLRLPKGPVVLAGGAVPLASTLRAPIPPPIATDADGWWGSVWRLKRLRELTDVVVVPGFEVSTLEDRRRSDVVVHGAKSLKVGAKDGTQEPAAGRPLRDRPRFPVSDPPATPPPIGRQGWNGRGERGRPRAPSLRPAAPSRKGEVALPGTVAFPVVEQTSLDDAEKGGKLVLHGRAPAADVEHSPAETFELVGDESAVAAPVQCLCADEGGRLLPRQADQDREAPGELRRLQVIGVAAERGGRPRPVGRVRSRLVPAAPERGKPVVADAARGEAGAHLFAVEMWPAT